MSRARDDRVVGQGADGQRLIDRVHPVDLRHIDPQQAWHLGCQVHPSGRRAAARQQRRDEGLGEAVRADVLRHVAGIEPGAITSLWPASRKRGDRGLVEQRPLADHRARRAGGNARMIAPSRLAERNRAEPHAAWLLRRAPRRAARRRVSARMDSAISGAVTASIASPTGPEFVRAPPRHGRAREGAEAVPHGFSASQARRCRMRAISARGRAPDRRASGRA